MNWFTHLWDRFRRTGAKSAKPIAPPRNTDAAPEPAPKTKSTHRPDDDPSLWRQRRPPVKLAIEDSATQAAALLEWLQAPDGRTGWISLRELEEILKEVCAERLVVPLSWLAISKRLSAVPGVQRKHVGPERELMWFIPSITTSSEGTGHEPPSDVPE